MISIFHIGTFVNYTLPPNSLNKQIELVLRLIYSALLKHIYALQFSSFRSSFKDGVICKLHNQLPINITD